MKYLSVNETANSYEEKMLRRKTFETADAAEIKHQTKRAKRYRSAFTTGQINYLEKQFKKFPYIGNACRKEVASVLNIPERAVKIWFQNRRMKEKKEAINKEYNLDRPNNSINNVELANDPLNNGHSLQSANDHQSSLKPAPSNHDNNINYTNYNVKSERNIREKVEYVTPHQLENKNIDKHEEQAIGKNMSSTTTNLSKFHLNRIYNNSNILKYLKTNEIDEVNERNLVPKIKTKETSKSVLAAPHNTPGTINYQDLPEDLSARNKSNAMFPQNHLENLNLSSAYIPLCNAQNYVTPCISAGSVMWKPINVMPIISPPPSSNLPLVVTDNELSQINQINMVKTNCNCNCHMKNLLNHEQGKISLGNSHPQYVIAIPINKTSN